MTTDSNNTHQAGEAHRSSRVSTDYQELNGEEIAAQLRDLDAANDGKQVATIIDDVASDFAESVEIVSGTSGEGSQREPNGRWQSFCKFWFHRRGLGSGYAYPRIVNVGFGGVALAAAIGVASVGNSKLTEHNAKNEKEAADQLAAQQATDKRLADHHIAISTSFAAEVPALGATEIMETGADFYSGCDLAGFRIWVSASEGRITDVVGVEPDQACQAINPTINYYSSQGTYIGADKSLPDHTSDVRAWCEFETGRKFWQVVDIQNRMPGMHQFTPAGKAVAIPAESCKP